METEFERQEELPVEPTDLPTADETPVVDPEVAVGQLAEAAHALEWLVDLQRTVSQEGASRHDITAMTEICGKLQGIGLGVTMSAGLEAYGPSHFTPNRSMLNQKLGLEGIGSTILATIKGWIQKLIDYVIDAYKWFRNLQSRDEVVSKKLENAVGKILKVLEETDRQIRFFKFDSKMHDVELKKFAMQLSEGKHLQRTHLTAAAFGYGIYLDPIVDLQKDCRLFGAAFISYLDTFKRYLVGDLACLDLDARLLDELKSMVTRAQSWQEQQPDPKFLSNLVTFDRLSTPINAKTRTAVHWESLLEVYTDSGKALKEIRRISTTINDPEETQAVAEVIRELSDALSNIGKLINTFSAFNRTQLAVIDCYWKFASRRYTLFMTSIRDTPMDGAVETLSRKAEAAFKEFMQGEGL
jgi:hypothetical protein